MTPQEQDMIAELIDRVQKTQLDEKDPDAETMLQQGLGRTPDALYILAQTVLVQKYALEQAQAQLAQARDQIQQLQQHPEPKHSSSFLGNLLGHKDSESAPPPPPPSQTYTPAQPPPYTPVPVSPGYAPDPGPYYGAPPPQRSGGGFLQNAMQTAAGVAAGALAFQGIESLMHGFGNAAGYGNAPGFGGFGGGERPTEIVNNYYDDRGDRGSDSGSRDVSPAERELGNEENYSTKDDATDGNQFYGADDNSDDTASLDDSSFDDSSNDFDDGGSDFSDDGSNFG